ncbi:HTH domain-containing protein [Cohnella rhizosphaerae]|uniref:HTH domain-containing protein n=1 Tax=Cohnella rhizosphaerae TaxID=1457232 RepID=A0A9X4KQS0_9BACL|nr:HTH domain-containing protein [Cohnella rhizosphaerae]MDG0809175.1 HTH domain-containing protein [Cohnella rhizosphaerae]
MERLLGITMLLLSRRRVNAQTLAGKFEVSHRTIYRDLETINAAGIPIVSFTGERRGLRDYGAVPDRSADRNAGRLAIHSCGAQGRSGFARRRGDGRAADEDQGAGRAVGAEAARGSGRDAHLRYEPVARRRAQGPDDSGAAAAGVEKSHGRLVRLYEYGRRSGAAGGRADRSGLERVRLVPVRVLQAAGEITGRSGCPGWTGCACTWSGSRTGACGWRSWTRAGAIRSAGRRSR